MRLSVIRPEYVDLIPRELDDGVLYISRKYGTASHRCCCGCGTKIVTPLRETEYRLTDQQGAVSLYPSIGNWNHPCQSHYWIRENQVVWAGRMTHAQIQRGREYDDALKQAYFSEPAKSWWQRLITWIVNALRSLFR